MKEQLGIVRTNCIDCLDRTNVTQVGWCIQCKFFKRFIIPSFLNASFLLYGLGAEYENKSSTLSIFWYVCICCIIFLLNNVLTDMQSMIGRTMLEFQLRRIGIFGAEETISSHPNLDDKYKICTCIANFQVTHLCSIVSYFHFKNFLLFRLFHRISNLDSLLTGSIISVG